MLLSVCVLFFLLPVRLILLITYRTKQLPFTLFNLQVLSGCFFFAFLPFITCCQPLITYFQFTHHVLSAHLSSACTYSSLTCYHVLSYLSFAFNLPVRCYQLIHQVHVLVVGLSVIMGCQLTFHWFQFTYIVL